MKRIFLLMLLSLPLLWSCSDKDEQPSIMWDILPLGWQFQVTDADGNDLLNPETPDAYGSGDIKITCTNLEGDGMETFYVGAYSGGYATRALLYDELSVYTGTIYNSDRYGITIVGYDPTHPWDKIEVNIEWPDGSKDYIEVHYTCWSGTSQFHSTTNIYLNGTEVPERFTIVK